MLYQEYNRRKNKMAEGAVIKKKIKRLLIPFGKEQPHFIQNLFLCVYKYNAMQAACRAGFGASAKTKFFRSTLTKNRQLNFPKRIKKEEIIKRLQHRIVF